MVKVRSVSEDTLTFEDGSTLYSNHDSECCEYHYLSFADLTMKDFEGLEFNLSSQDFFERVADYGIRLLPDNGQTISVPGYGYNNGYYSHHLELILKRDDSSTTFDITECQALDY